MELNDYVFTLGNFSCNKNCPYCIAKMNRKKTKTLEEEIIDLKQNIKKYKEENKIFQYFILSGNGEPSFYSYQELKQIKEIVEESKIFKDFRIQTSGFLFFDKEKLTLFENWLKEITVISENSEEDQTFYHYKKEYLRSKSFWQSRRIRVNIVLLKKNFDKLNSMLAFYENQNNVETIALKILDYTDNDSKESIWVKENAIFYDDIDSIIKVVQTNHKLVNFYQKTFIFKAKNRKRITIHYDPFNQYDYMNLKSDFCWHNKKIKKGVYGDFSKIEEEIEEAKDALDQKNHLMFLIELSDIIGAIEGVAEKNNLTLEDLISFSNKVKESKKI